MYEGYWQIKLLQITIHLLSTDGAIVIWVLNAIKMQVGSLQRQVAFLDPVCINLYLKHMLKMDGC